MGRQSVVDCNACMRSITDCRTYMDGAHETRRCACRSGGVETVTCITVRTMCDQAGTLLTVSGACVCNTDYSGVRCEIYTPPTTINPCLNYCQSPGALRCERQGNIPQCICNTGYSGPRCGIYTPPTTVNPCLGYCQSPGSLRCE